MKKNVSNSLKNIGTCRDLLEEKDFKKIRGHIYLFEKTHLEASRAMSRYTKDRKSPPDYTPDDMKDIANEIKSYLEKDFPIEFTYDDFLKVLEETQNGEVNNEILKKYIAKVCDYMYVDTKLRESMKIFAYIGVLLKLWNINYEKYGDDDDIMFQLTEAMKGFLR